MAKQPGFNSRIKVPKPMTEAEKQAAQRKQNQNKKAGPKNRRAAKATAARIRPQANQFIEAGTGQAGPAPQATPTTAGQASTAQAPAQIDTSLMEATTVTPQVEEAMDQTTAAQGQVSQDAQAQAATVDPTQATQLELEAEQIDQARQVEGAPTRTVQAGELVSGSTVDMDRVADVTGFEAAQATPTEQATVQGQLSNLMQDLEGGKTPPWAAGAMRQAQAMLQQRGLGASSIAGQAVIQATMEAAVPIAMADAQTFASFESQNLSNRQQAAMFGAQQRAQFLGMEFDQAFQTRVLNASRIADIADINFSAQQQVALENARLAQTVDLENLSARNAKLMADVATMAQMDLANLNNRQQAAVQNAQAFLQMDMANLSNEQQTTLFKAQSRVQAMLSDQAALNTAAQINAQSENQTEQFMATLSAQVSQFNATQKNAMKQFNASEVNDIKQFNTALKSQREEFNAQNSLVIAQANAQWRQQIATQAQAAKNAANLQHVKDINGITSLNLDAIWQRERDTLQYAFLEGENELDRANRIALEKLRIEANEEAAEFESKQANKRAFGGFVGKVATSLLFGV